MEQAVVAYKARNPFSDVEDKLDFYQISSVFEQEGQGLYSYWCRNIKADRFENSKLGILYRPTITNEIVQAVEECFKIRGRRGLMIKGPQGIGKSHSMISVYRKLVTSKKCLVTFIPYCKDWQDKEFFLHTVCASLGINVNDLGLNLSIANPLSIELLRNVVTVIGDLLRKHGLKWVFMFDQINALFTHNPQARKLAELPEPFRLVDDVLRSQLVTSVIAASANNEFAYKESHEDFTEYIHPHQFRKEDEFKVFVDRYRRSMEEETHPPGDTPDTKLTATNNPSAIDSKANVSEIDNETDADEERIDEEMVDEETDEYARLLQIAGGVPWYTFRYLEDPNGFQRSIKDEVEHSFNKIKNGQDDWNLVLESLICSLLLIPTSSSRYDKKYFIKVPEGATHNRYHALFPAITGACKSLLWNDLMNYIEKSEAQLLEVCKDKRTTNDTRGRIFESIAIRRMHSAITNVDLGNNDTFSIAAGHNEVPGDCFPELEPQTGAKTYIPVNPNFPAIDWIWVSGKSIFGVQSHVSDHDDVLDTFVAKARAAKWFDKFDRIELLYFSPEEATTNLVQQRVQPETVDIPLGKTTRHSGCPKNVQVKRKAISISSLSSVKDLVWPLGCSLPKKLEEREFDSSFLSAFP